MKGNTKKYLIYIRYSLPIFALLITTVMLFVPSYRFIFSGKLGERMSVATLISNSWEQARGILFGTAEHTDAAMIFSKILFALIILSVLLLLFSICVSIWSAIVAFRCFLDDDEEETEKFRRIFTVFVPNRIVLCILSSIGLVIAIFPYLMKPIYAFTYSQQVTAVLEAPDALIVGGALILASCIISIICSYIEKELEADIFDKGKDGENVALAYDDADDIEYQEIDSEAKENIRRLFNVDNDKNDKDK